MLDLSSFLKVILLFELSAVPDFVKVSAKLLSLMFLCSVTQNTITVECPVDFSIYPELIYGTR